MEGLTNLKNLNFIELNDNQIKSISNYETLINLNVFGIYKINFDNYINSYIIEIKNKFKYLNLYRFIL